MKSPSHPPDELRRLETLRQYGVLDTLPEQALDDLAALAAYICDAPISTITLIDAERQWFKATVGLSTTESSRDESFCAHAILEPDVFVVPDTSKDERFADNPHVTGDPYIRFYAGAPLIAADGQTLGTLCIIDRVPRELSPKQYDALRVLSRQVMAQLELRRQTRSVADSEARLFEVFSSCPVGISVHRWHDRTFVDANAAFLALTGWTRDDVIGKTTEQLQIVTREQAAGLRQQIQEHATVRGVDVEIATRDGATRHVLVGTSLVELRGEPHVVSTFVDITERTQADVALRESEERLRLALDAAHMGTFDWDIVHGRITWSRWHEELWGFEPGEFQGTYESFSRPIHPDDVLVVNAEVERCIATHEPFASEFRVIWPDSSVHWVAGRGEFHFDASGTAVRLRGVVVETTARREAQEALRRTNERFEIVARATNDAVWDWDLATDALWWNEGFLTLFGYSEAEAGTTIDGWTQRIHPDDLERVVRGIHDVIDHGGHSWSDEYRFRRRDETFATILDRGYVIRKPDGKAVRMMGAMQDVSAQEQAEAKASVVAQRLTLATDAAAIGVWDWDLEADEWYASPTYDTMLGYDPAEAVSNRDVWLERVHPDDRALVSEKIRATLAGGPAPYSYEARMRHADGSYRWISVVGRVLRVDAHGNARRLLGVRTDITDRKRAEEEREQIFERITDAFVALDTKWRYTYVNPKAAQLFGEDAKNLLGKQIWNSFPDGVGHPFHLAYEKAMERQEPAHLEAYYPPFGRWFENRIYPSREGLSIYFHDITERKRVEHALRERDHLLREAQRIGRVGGWVYDIALDRLNWSDELYRIFAVDPAQFDATLEGYFSLLHPDDQDRVRRAIEHAVLSGTRYDGEERIIQPNGAERILHTRCQAELDATGNPVRIVGVSLDITDRKQSERQIRRLNRVYAVSSEINQAIVREPDSLKMLGMACRIAVEKGQLLMAWIGLTDPAEPGLRIVAHAGASDDTLSIVRELLHNDSAGRECSFTMRALSTGQHAVCHDIAQDGATWAWRDAAKACGCRSMVSLPLQTGGRVAGTLNLYSGEVGFFDDEELRLLDELAVDIGFALDVHAREAEAQRTQHALRESEDRFRELAENIQEVFWMTDSVDHALLYISPAYETVWGRSRASLYASPLSWIDSVHPEDRDRIAHAIEVKQFRGDYDETYRILRPDSTIRWIHDRAFPIRRENGTVIRVVGTAEDITDRRHLEEQFRQSQKMEAIGQLAGGVAHDFNNILAAIMMQADLAATAVGLPAETRELLDDIKSATDRAAHLTRQLLAFSRRQIMQPRLLDVNDIVTSLAKMLQRILGEDVRLQLDLHPRALFARADAGMLDQVLLNLVINARDAMPDGGRLTIETAERYLTPHEVLTIPDATPGRHACLRVSDTGSGIAPEHMARIFEPFFTTKETGKGTGLGLAMVFGIIKQHSGSVRVASDVGTGTTFEIFLPASEDEGTAPDTPAIRSEPRGGAESILLVEDDAAVRTLTRVVLERAGYTVFEAAHGVAALQVWKQRASAIRLLLTDIVMPEGIGGRELADRLLARNPALRVVFTSGYSADIAGKELQLEEGQNFIQKPASPVQLLEIVRRCLDA